MTEEEEGPRTGVSLGGVAVLFGGLVFTTYLLLALRLGDLYPLSDFTMFAEPISAPSRVMARLGDGEVVEVTDLVGWACPADLGMYLHISVAYDRIVLRTIGSIPKH